MNFLIKDVLSFFFQRLSWKVLNCLNFTKEEILSGNPAMEDYDIFRNEYMEDDCDDCADVDQYLKKQFLKDKCVADAVEALFGVYLQKMGYKGM